MGVELRSIQHKFSSLMEEVRPQIKPRFIVWLDERLAEFKIKGSMDLGETLEDPQWIKEYYKSKREAKAAAIQKRGNKANSSSGGGSIHAKLEAKSESSNGHAHPDELQGTIHEEKVEATEQEPHVEEKSDGYKETTDQSKETGFQLVEVKQEHVQDDDDDDMIIIGETLAAQPQSLYQTVVNPTRQSLTGLGTRTNFSSLQKKRQRFGINAPRPLVSFSSRRFKSHSRPSFRTSSATNVQEIQVYPSQHDFSTSSQTFPTTSSSYADDNSQSYDTGGDGGTFSQYYSQSESLRLPEHLQTHSSNVNMTESEPYTEGGDDMYADYGEESYDSSYMIESAETSLQYDEDGNAILQGDQTADETSTGPLPGTSDESHQDASFNTAFNARNCLIKSFDGTSIACSICSKTFTTRSNAFRHINFIHFNSSKFECSLCSRYFQTREELTRHMNGIHYKVRPFACNCGKAFKCKKDLVQHQMRCRLVQANI